MRLYIPALGPKFERLNHILELSFGHLQDLLGLRVNNDIVYLELQVGSPRNNGHVLHNKDLRMVDGRPQLVWVMAISADEVRGCLCGHCTAEGRLRHVPRTMSSFISVMSHETVHLCQLVFGLLGDRMWKGRRITDRELFLSAQGLPEYRELPWEKVAFQKQEKLRDQVITLLKERDSIDLALEDKVFDRQEHGT